MGISRFVLITTSRSEDWPNIAVSIYLLPRHIVENVVLLLSNLAHDVQLQEPDE
jgi:hypothetical protein